MSGIGPGFRPPQDAYPSLRSDKARRMEGTPAPTPVAAVSPGFNPCVSPDPGALPSFSRWLTAMEPLSSQQLALLLKNLLQMPKELVRLLAMLATDETPTEQALVLALLTENPDISVEALQQFLLTRLGRAGQSLMALLQTAPLQEAQHDPKFSDMMNVLSELSGKISASPEEALHTTVSLYLPYYPLHPPQAFTLRFAPPPSDEESGAAGREDDLLRLIIEIRTVTLGDFRIAIRAEGPGCWSARAAHHPEASAFIPEIRSHLDEALADCRMQAFGSAPLTVEFLERRLLKDGPTETHAGSSVSKSNPQWHKPKAGPVVEIHPASNGRVSAALIQIAYLLIRAILETDQRNMLRQSRAEELSLEEDS